MKPSKLTPVGSLWNGGDKRNPIVITAATSERVSYAYVRHPESIFNKTVADFLYLFARRPELPHDGDAHIHQR